LPGGQSALLVEVADSVGEDGADNAGAVLEPKHPHDGLAHLVAAVPAAELCCDAGEHAGLGEAEEEARGVEAFFVLDGCVGGEDDAPGEDDAGLPVAGGHAFEEHVGGDFEDDVGDEVDGLDPVVLVRGHAELDEHVCWFAYLQDFYSCGVLVVDLLNDLAVSIVLITVYDIQGEAA